MDYIKKNGETISEAWMDAIADGAEADELPGIAVGVQEHRGRPALFEGEDMVTLSFRIARSRADALARVANQAGESKSDMLRRAVDAMIATA